MDESTVANIRDYLAMSDEDLAAAAGLIELASYRQALSRCYYAVFYAASALLMTQGIQRHRHSGVHSALSEQAHWKSNMAESIPVFVKTARWVIMPWRSTHLALRLWPA